MHKPNELLYSAVMQVPLIKTMRSPAAWAACRLAGSGEGSCKYIVTKFTSFAAVIVSNSDRIDFLTLCNTLRVATVLDNFSDQRKISQEEY